MKKNTIKIILDIIMLIAFIFLMEPWATGLYLHEWAGILVVAVFIIHLVLNWIWIKVSTGSFFRKMPSRNRLKYILNWLILVGFTLVVYSGMKIAKLIDFSWLGMEGSMRFWRFGHTSFSFITLILVAIHLGLNWQWVVRRFSPLMSGISKKQES